MRGGDETLKILLITVAGMSKRFSESVGKECLKCIYYNQGIEESLLYRLLHQSESFDKYILVGGFMFEELQKEIEQHFKEMQNKIILVKNDKYKEYGSGYSLYKGLEEAVKLQFDELIFTEGDLFFDRASFRKIVSAEKNVITYNRDPIWANKAVAFYFDQNYQIHYTYDGNHRVLEIVEPFLGIFNSGQVWKFFEFDRVKNIMKSMNEEAWKGTNLVFIQKYFESMQNQKYELIGFENWINCNTIIEFEKIGGDKFECEH